MFKWLRKRIPPETPTERKTKYTRVHDDEPILTKPTVKRKPKSKRNNKTIVNVKLNETQVAEVSFSEKESSDDECDWEDSDETDQFRDDVFSVLGNMKPNKSDPTPKNSKRKRPLVFQSPPLTEPDLDEDEIYSRYADRPVNVNDLVTPTSNKINQALSSQRTGPKSTRPQAADLPLTLEHETKKTSSTDFYENHMVEWDD